MWRVAKPLSYIEDARCLKVKYIIYTPVAGKSCVVNQQKRRVHHGGTVSLSREWEWWRREGRKRQETEPNKVNIAARKMLFVFNEGLKKRNTS